MAETQNRARMAELLSEDIFPWLKWGQRPLMNDNWECVYDEHKVKTHPSDVVVYYHHPYLNVVKYLNVDLKSYGKGTINNNQIGSALRSLAKSVQCANVSQSWRKKYAIDDDLEVDGLLFIYNHDSEYDTNFRGMLKAIDSKSIPLPPPRRIHVFGPELICRISDIVTDIKMFVADQTIPSISDYAFYYPDLVNFKTTGDEWSLAAIPEALTAPWIIIKHKIKDSSEAGYIIYYNSKGDTFEEFVYLMDYLSHNQILLSSALIKVRFVRPGKEAAINFDKAQHFYLEHFGIDEAREQKIWRIKYRSITNNIKSFSETEIGMGL
jgi:hypothetical protein